MSKKTIIVENNTGLLAQIGKLITSRPVLAMLAIMGWGLMFRGWWWQEDVCRQRFLAATKKAEKIIAKENLSLSRAARARLEADRRREARRRAAMQAADRALGRYEGKTDAVVPADVHGKIQEVR